MDTHDAGLAIRVESAESPVAQVLIAALDAELNVRYPGLPTHGIDGPRFADTGGVFAVGYLDGDAVACGALRPWESGGEIKRMFVDARFRGRGFSRAILGFLEAAARARGYTHLVLETGDRQHEALGLYRSSGWSPIATYGEYVDALHESRCFEKRLDA